MEDNCLLECSQLRNEEVEALAAIYGNDWHVEDANGNLYSIQIISNYTSSDYNVTLQVCLPDDYPLLAPPTYQLSAPWLRGAERINLESLLQDSTLEHCGENLVHIWIDVIRAFVQQKIDSIKEGNLVTAENRLIEVKKVLLLKHDINVVSAVTKQLHLNDALTVCPQIISGEVIEDRRSKFQAHIASVFSEHQVTQVLTQLLSNIKIAKATHNIRAWRLQNVVNNVTNGNCDDDGEAHAGGRLLHLLTIAKVANVLVVVSRWYGGIQLGPDRFKHINNCARLLLQREGYIIKDSSSLMDYKSKPGKAKS